MTLRLFTDRSRYEDGLRCARLRWYGYHHGERGIRAAKTPLPLAVGGSVHEGLAAMLSRCMTYYDQNPKTDMYMVEDEAVRVALADFAQYRNEVEVDTQEQAAMSASLAAPAPATLASDLMDSMGWSQSAGEERENARASATTRFDEYLYAEQSALVEAMVRAYARRRLRPLLEQFEVLEVEREGEWKLGDVAFAHDVEELWFMSRPDALLRERATNTLFLQSYKTAASWDVRKARDAEHDMQGMSEGIEVERRLAFWWEQLHKEKVADRPDITVAVCKAYGINTAMYNFLWRCDAPPRILAVRYEYLLKGERWKDKELSAQFGMEMRSQRSHLIRRYVATSTPMRGQAAYAVGDECWSWDYVKDDGSAGSLAWQNWKSRPVWDAGRLDTHDGVRAWIDKLDTAAETMSAEDPTAGLEPRLLGYGCDAQAMGVTREHPLDAAFVPPITVYRNEDELRDLVDQMEAVERRVQEGAMAVHAAGDESERRHALNVHFPQNRKVCEYPSTCAFSKICYGSDEMKGDPLGSGFYKIRTVNHPQELQGNMEKDS